MASFTTSDLLGYASIGCWLGAQFPQVLENYQRQSVEGLAWPFLANWLAATVPIDVTLVGQYVYYSSASQPAPAYPSSYPSARLRSTSSATITRRLSLERPPTHYRALSNVAANVAAAAALAAQQEEQARWHPQRRKSGHDTDNVVNLDEDEDEVDEEALARLADSFHSEGGRSTYRKKVSWSRERGGSLGRSHPPTMSPIPSSLHIQTSPAIGGVDEFDVVRGRPLSRGSPLVESPEDEWGNASTAQRRSSRASRKGASMVFLGVWALFGVGTLAGSKRGLSDGSRTQVGRVLADEVVAVPSPSSLTTSVVDIPAVASIASAGSLDSAPTSFDELRFVDEIPPHDPHEDDGPSMDYIVGRISAWICTTLYLTSRLPQIWKNYVRKSVEGLSMSLFIFAFLGNFLYVASILTSSNLRLPEPEASAFLRESIPYLLGSGGTLMFDVTIVTQSFLYRSKAHSRGRRPSRADNEEEQGLLGAGTTGAEEVTTPSRRRMTAPSEGAD
ncbi:hypothetical protein EIP86_010870 [Pleurotus ostreatoroseus]|nr:hypothetical protein EIP86_010870 [Pleurotus ostreatoroseus]